MALDAAIDRDRVPGLSQGTRLDTEKQHAKVSFPPPLELFPPLQIKGKTNEILPTEHRNILQPFSNESSKRKFGKTGPKLLDACMQLLSFHLLLQILLI